MVELHAIRHEAGGRVLLDAREVRFRPARFNVILGPNGAGKSTLLRIAAGLLAPTAGAVRFDGRPLAAFEARALARRRAVLSQHVELAFPLSVREVVLMGRYPHYGRTPSARDEAIVDGAIERVGMTDRRAQPYPTLSGGERQKVQFARVLAQIWDRDAPGDAPDGAPGPARCVFLDEPTASLDVRYRLHLLDLARDLLRHGCTVVAVLHDLNVAFEYGDRLFLLDGGRLAHVADRPDGIPREVLERVFAVRAHPLPDPGGGQPFWRFTL